MAPTWAQLLARVWAVARVALRSKRKAYRRLARRWRFRHGVTLYSRDRAYAESLERPAGTPIPVRTQADLENVVLQQLYTAQRARNTIDLGYIGLNDMLKQVYTQGLGAAEMIYDAEHEQHVLKVLPSPLLPPREPDELDDNAFIFPCHRGLH